MRRHLATGLPADLPELCRRQRNLGRIPGVAQTAADSLDVAAPERQNG
jgi:hypothetical protein